MVEIIIKKDLSLTTIVSELKKSLRTVAIQSSGIGLSDIRFICLGNLLINDEKPGLLQDVNEYLDEIEALLYVMRGDLDKPSSFPNVIGRVILLADVAVLPSGTVLISPGTSVHGHSKPMVLDGSIVNMLKDIVASKVIMNIDYIHSVSRVRNVMTHKAHEKLPEANILSLELDYIDNIISCLESNSGFSITDFKVYTYSQTRSDVTYSATKKTSIQSVIGGEYFIL